MYRMNNMLNLTKEQIDNVNAVIHKFMWNGKHARISRETLIRNKEHGGLKLVDLTSKQKALKANGFSKYCMTTLLKNVYMMFFLVT